MMLLQESGTVNKTLDVEQQLRFVELHDGPRERNSEYQQGLVATIMIFKSGPRGGPDLKTFSRLDQEQGY